MGKQEYSGTPLPPKKRGVGGGGGEKETVIHDEQNTQKVEKKSAYFHLYIYTCTFTFASANQRIVKYDLKFFFNVCYCFDASY